MILWMFLTCVLNVSVEASICMSLLRLMLLVSVVSLLSIILASSFMALMKSFFDTSEEDTMVLLMVWAFWAMTFLMSACAKQMTVFLGLVLSMLPLYGTKPTCLLKMYVNLWSYSM